MAKTKFAFTAIKEAIDRVVRTTGLPAVAAVLCKSGVADRETLRKMERKGIIQRINLRASGTLHIGYYTEDELPGAVRKWREQKDAELR